MTRAMFFCLIAWIASAGPTQAQEEVLAAIKKLGGEAVSDPASPGNPIVAVNL